MMKVKKVETPEEALKIWNAQNPGQRATLKQVKKCDCGHCSGFVIISNSDHSSKKFK